MALDRAARSAGGAGRVDARAPVARDRVPRRRAPQGPSGWTACGTTPRAAGAGRLGPGDRRGGARASPAGHGARAGHHARRRHRRGARRLGLDGGPGLPAAQSPRGRQGGGGNSYEGATTDRIGLVVFAGQSLTKSPPTTDAGVLLRQLDDVRLDMLPDGTAIGSGLGTALTRLRYSQAKSKVIVLVTDGANNAERSIPPPRPTWRAPWTCASTPSAWGAADRCRSRSPCPTRSPAGRRSAS